MHKPPSLIVTGHEEPTPASDNFTQEHKGYNLQHRPLNHSMENIAGQGSMDIGKANKRSLVDLRSFLHLVHGGMETVHRYSFLVHQTCRALRTLNSALQRGTGVCLAQLTLICQWLLEGKTRAPRSGAADFLTLQ